MENLIKIMIVEDEMIIAAKISMELSNLGYLILQKCIQSIRIISDLL